MSENTNEQNDKNLSGLKKLLDKVPDPYKECMIGTFLGVPLFGILTTIALALELKNEIEIFEIFLLVCTCGWTAGWFAGVLYTPKSEEEKKGAEKTYKFIATFTSGFLIGIITPFIEHVKQDKIHLFLYLKGFLFFFTTFLTTLLVTIVMRRYYEDPFIENKEEKMRKELEAKLKAEEKKKIKSEI